MPFDPSLPAANSPLQSQVIRDQLQALFGLINNLVTVNAAQVDAVTTLPAGSPAQVSVSVTGSTLHFSFSLPRGQTGAVGPEGPPGNDGGQGPPFASAVVDGVATLEPGEPATVDATFDGTDVRFSFGIPRGNDGAEGPSGPPGEITQAQLDAAIEGTSPNTNAISTLDSTFADPDLESVREKLNELILNGRR